jgi:hypothetical protein
VTQAYFNEVEESKDMNPAMSIGIWSLLFMALPNVFEFWTKAILRVSTIVQMYQWCHCYQVTIVSVLKNLPESNLICQTRPHKSICPGRG